MKTICDYITDQDVKQFCEHCRNFYSINGCELMQEAYKRKLEDNRNKLRLEGEELHEQK